jgi:uncharacterized membrane protein YedE/YeeE
LANLSIKPAYLGGVAVGGIIFGIGWAVSGYCPGTCVVGASEGKWDAIFTVIGGLAGAAIFAMAYPVVEAALLAPLDFGKVTLQEITGLNSVYLALPLSAMLLSLAFFVLKDRYD